jgi:hypothetical protein
MLPSADEERSIYLLHRNDADDPGYRKYLEPIAESLLGRLRPGSRGLDYGCGPDSALAAMLREAGHDVALYDPLFHPDSDALAGKYDFITCSEVIEHFHRPYREFAKLDAMLGPGGILAIMTRFLTDSMDFQRWHYRRDPTHVVFYREQTLRQVAHRFGWVCAIPCANVALLSKPAIKVDAATGDWVLTREI